MSPSETGASEDDSIGAADGEAVVSVVACATSGGDEREVGSVTLERDPRRQQQTVRVSNAASRAGRRVRLRVVADQPPLEWRVREDDATGGTGTATAALVRFRAGTLVLESRVTFPRARTCHVGDAPTERALAARARGGRAAPLRAFVVRHPPVREEQRFRKRRSRKRDSARPRDFLPPPGRRDHLRRRPRDRARGARLRARASPSRCRETCFSPSGNRRAARRPLAGRLGPRAGAGRRRRKGHAGARARRRAERCFATRRGGRGPRPRARPCWRAERRGCVTSSARTCAATARWRWRAS